MSFARECRERLIMLKEAGVKTFTCYDLLSKHAQVRELRAIHSYISDRCTNGEIATVLDKGGHPKKIRPSNPPAWMQNKNLIRVYEFKTFGEKDRHNEKKTYAPAKYQPRHKKISEFQKTWQDIYPELFKNPHKTKVKVSMSFKGDI